MVAQKKVMTKGQIVAHFVGKFEVSRKAAASMIDEYAAPAMSLSGEQSQVLIVCYDLWGG